MVLVQIGVGAVALYAMAMLGLPDCDCRTRPRSNEVAAITTLRLIHAAEGQFMTRVAVDRDGDGVGEAGTLAELAGAGPLRATAGATEARPPTRPPLSREFGKPIAGPVHRGGYFFALYLPGGNGGWKTDGDEADIEASEHGFCICAWPDEGAAISLRAFFLDADGTLWSYANQDRRYRGPGQPLSATDAEPVLPVESPDSRIGRDGLNWIAMR